MTRAESKVHVLGGNIVVSSNRLELISSITTGSASQRSLTSRTPSMQSPRCPGEYPSAPARKNSVASVTELNSSPVMAGAVRVVTGHHRRRGWCDE